MAPSAGRPDIIYKVYPRSMTHHDIMHVIKCFAESAKRAQKAGFDGIQIHAAHGYLISEFLSPYFNRRKDEWGGNPEKEIKFKENYNHWACRRIKPVMHDIPLILVGGLRTYQVMERIIQEKNADFIAMSRPLIRDPFMIKKWRKDHTNGFTCTNCNNCLGAMEEK